MEIDTIPGKSFLQTAYGLHYSIPKQLVKRYVDTRRRQWHVMFQSFMKEFIYRIDLALIKPEKGNENPHSLQSRSVVLVPVLVSQ